MVQRRCLRAARDLTAGQALRREDVEVLRPSPPEAIQPYDLQRVMGRVLRVSVPRGAHLAWDHVGEVHAAAHLEGRVAQPAFRKA